ncbi:MAG: efflux RND transporter permease subunit [Flavobacteriales bacterium]|nr:efflux RND transporter permease subunit [Flavobacteriales bacterium]
MMVLYSLILALGMLVDNGIVVVENVYRLMDEGMSAWDAARHGVGEVAVPIIASTATTLAAFLPLAVWPGIMGEFMFWLPITLITVLSSSLFVALVINPVLTSVLMKTKEEPANRNKLMIISFSLIATGFLFRAGDVKIFGSIMIIGGVLGFFNYYFLSPAAKWFQSKFLPRLENNYHRFVSFALRGYNPLKFFFATIFFLVVSAVLMGLFPPKVTFFPSTDPQYVNIFIEAPIGTDIIETDRITREVESRIMNYIKKFEDASVGPDNRGTGNNFLVKSVIAQVGEGAADPSQGPSMETTPHKSRVTVSFVEFQFRREVSTTMVMEEMRTLVSDIPGVQIVVDKNNDGPPTGKPINIEISGDDYDQLIAEALRVQQFIEEKRIAGVEELKLDVELGKPEMIVNVDRLKARRFNVSTYQIGSNLRTSLFGQDISTFKDGEDDFDVVLRLDEKYRNDADILLNQKITFRDQTNGQIRQIPISAIASAEATSTYSAVKRKNQKRVITIASNVLDGYNPNEVVAEIKKTLTEYDLPDENTLAFTGEQEEQSKEMAFLGNALMIAVFLIFLIIVSQFNSASTPAIIVASVIFSLIGVFMGLVIFRMEFVVIMTMIGIISLAGVVVNNAIVLIDYTNLVMARRMEALGIDRDKGDRLSVHEVIFCLEEAGKTRLRPVLLTAITTVLGLLPLATGMNIDFFGLLRDWAPNIYFGGDNVAFWGPMSWTVIFGLTFATFLTLVIVPVMYYLLIRFKYRFFKPTRQIAA